MGASLSESDHDLDETDGVSLFSPPPRRRAAVQATKRISAVTGGRKKRTASKTHRRLRKR